MMRTSVARFRLGPARRVATDRESLDEGQFVEGKRESEHMQLVCRNEEPVTETAV